MIAARCVVCGWEGEYDEESPMRSDAVDPDTGVTNVDPAVEWRFADGRVAGVCGVCRDNPNRTVSAFRLVEHELTKVVL